MQRANFDEPSFKLIIGKVREIRRPGRFIHNTRDAFTAVHGTFVRRARRSRDRHTSTTPELSARRRPLHDEASAMWPKPVHGGASPTRGGWITAPAPKAVRVRSSWPDPAKFVANGCAGNRRSRAVSGPAPPRRQVFRRLPTSL